jgi:hypothetical protein
MAVYRDSRYDDGDAQQIKNKTTGAYAWTVYREFPGSRTITYIDYTWVDGDRLDYLAAVYLRDSTLWWQILDINPGLPDALEIEPGTIIRVPRG